MNFNDLTIKEKLSILSGESYWKTKSIKRLNIKSLQITDGPHGIRKQKGKDDMLGINESYESICFPTASLAACSFNKELLYKMGLYLGREAVAKEVDLVLGPGINLKRNPLCGRNFEYFSEDSFLSQELSKELINGIESTGASSALKHFICNNQENYRMVYNVNVDERTFNEVYLDMFGNVIKSAMPSALMTSYNKVNGIYMNENKELFDKVRTNYNYNGIYITDWGGITDIVKSFKSGLNLEMPGCDKTRVKYLYKMYKKNKITKEEIDNASKPVFDFITKKREKDYGFNIEDSKKVALDIANESIVLLKNLDNILPLDKSNKYTVIGDFAMKPKYQGSGSSKINSYEAKSFLEVLDEVNISYVYQQGYTRGAYLGIPEELILDTNIAIVFIGQYSEDESEGYDKKNIDLPFEQIEVIKELKKHNKKIIGVIQTSSPLIIPDGLFDGLILTYLGGMMISKSTYNVMFGDVNPSGRLQETWPISLDSLNMEYPINGREIYYKEGEYIGYKYYINTSKDVLYPFGYGLSYSKVQYLNFNITNTNIEFDLINNNLSSNEVIEIYLENSDSINKYRRLVYFDKIQLNPFEQKHISIKLDKNVFKFYDIDSHSFLYGKGVFKVLIGKSATDILYSKDISQDGDKIYQVPTSNIEFNEIGIDKSKRITINSTFSDLNKKWLGRVILRIIKRITKKIIKKNKDMGPIIENMLLETPLRQIPMSTNFKFNYYKVCGLVDILNGHIIRGIIGLFK